MKNTTFSHVCGANTPALKSVAECARSCDAMRVFPTSDSFILIPASYETSCWAGNTSNMEQLKGENSFKKKKVPAVKS